MSARKIEFVVQDSSGNNVGTVFDVIRSTDLPTSPPLPPSPPSGAGGGDGQIQFNRQGMLDGTTCIHWDYANGVLVITGGMGQVTPGTFGLLIQNGVDGPYKVFLGNSDSAVLFQDPVRSVTICSGLNGVAITYVPNGSWPMGGPTPNCVWQALDILNVRVAALEAAP